MARSDDDTVAGCVGLLLVGAVLCCLPAFFGWLNDNHPGILATLIIGPVALLIVWANIHERRDRRPEPPPPPPEITFERAEFRVDPVPEISFVEEPPAPLEAAKCLVCRVELDDDVVTCRRCRTPHHRACFRFARRCSVYACGGLAWDAAPPRWRPKKVRWDPRFRSDLRGLCLALRRRIRKSGGRCVHCGSVSRLFRLVDDGVSLPHLRCLRCRRPSEPEIAMTPPGANRRTRMRQGVLDFS